MGFSVGLVLPEGFSSFGFTIRAKGVSIIVFGFTSVFAAGKPELLLFFISGALVVTGSFVPLAANESAILSCNAAMLSRNVSLLSE